MPRTLSTQALVVSLLVLLCLPGLLWAHGFAGKRFFPTTLAIDDPFVSDELSFLLSHMKESGDEEEPDTVATELSAEYAKRITPHLGISLGGEFLHLNPDREDTENGFGNLEVGAKYQFFTNARHEALLSLGLEAEVGNTGNAKVGAESFSVLSPGLFFGKGLGDLPEAVRYLRPLALTGIFAVNVPTDSDAEATLSWGFSVQYNLQYLQSFVKDVGLGVPFNRMIPLVELAFETCVNHDCKGDNSGTVNPGLIWFGKSIELGAEAVVPINHRSGEGVGFLFLLHFFIDDLFPQSLGRPFFPTP
jgi:hypothetical protein